MSPVSRRTANEVINQAIRENRFGERLLYLFAVLTFLAGLGLLGFGAYRRASVTEVLGAVSSLMFYPAMRLARKIREQNVAIRLLEIPLSNSKTAEEAAAILKEFFASTIATKREGHRKP